MPSGPLQQYTEFGIVEMVTLRRQDDSQPRWRRPGLRMTTALTLVALLSLPAACTAPNEPQSTAGQPSAVHADASRFGSDDQIMADGTLHRSSSLGLGKYLAGRMAQAEADTAAAAAYYVAALAVDPTNVVLARRAYYYLLAEGKTEPAMALAERVMELDPSSTIAPLVLAVGQTARGDYAGAAARLDPVSQRGLNSFLVPMMRAWALAGSEKWDAALTALAPMKQDPQLAQMYAFHAGLIMDLANRPAQARKFYQTTLDGSDTLSLRTAEVISSFFYRQGEPDKAQALIDQYRSQHPDSPMVDVIFAGADSTQPDQQAKAFDRPIKNAAEGMAEALYGAATSVVQSRALDTALVFARLSLVLRPDFPFPEMMIGDILDTQDRPQDALKIYTRIGQGSPVYFTTRLRMALAYERLDKLSEADTILSDLAKAYPNRIEPLVARGDLARHQKEWTRATEFYRQALDKFEGPERQKWALYYSLGISLERSRHWPEAEEALKTALVMMPNQPQVLNYLGYSWIDRGIRLQEGKALIEKAVMLAPTDGYIIDSLGWAYYLTGDYDKAVDELEKAIEYTPADPTINDHLGDAYWRVGRTLEATFQWKRALSLDPPKDEIETLQDKLKNGLPDPGSSH